MGAWVGRVNCFYISWKRSFHSPVELDLTPTWPKLWSCHRAHPSPQIGNLIVAISPGSSSHIQYFSPSCFNIAIITIPSLSLARCRLFWFLWGSSRHLLSTWKHVFTKSFIDSGYPKHPMQSWSDLLFKAAPKYELKIWLHAWLTASMDSEFPKVGFRMESRFTDNGENSAQYCSECPQDESGMSIEFTLLVFNMFAWILNRKSRSKVNSTIRMFNSSKAVFKVNFEKVFRGTILF